MASTPEIVVRYIADTNRLKAATADVSKVSGKAAQGLRAAFLPAVGALAAVGVAAHKAVGDASDLNEQVNKTTVVFGKSSKAVLSWSKTTADSMGISQRASLEAAGTFGNMLVPMGIAEPKAAAMSKRMVKLAADMASFNNADPSETLEAIRSGLAGETEPLRRFGVQLNDARLKAEAMAQGIYKGKGPLTAQQKTLAAYSLMLKDTAKANGDFERTSGSLANQQRINAAKMEELSATFGKALLPVMTQLMGIVGPVMEFFAKHTTTLTILIGVVTALAAAIVVMNVAMAVTAAIAAGVAAPILAIVAAIALLTVAAVLVVKHWDTIKAATARAWSAVKSAVTSALSAIRSAVSSVINWIRSNWMLLLGILTGPIGLAVALIIRYWGQIRAATQAAWNAIRGVVSSVIGAIRNVVSTGFNAILAVARAAWNAFVSVIRGAVGRVRGAVQAIIAAIKGAFAGAGTWLISAGRAIVEGLASGITSAMGRALGAAQALADKVKGVISGVKGFITGSPSRWAHQQGQWVVAGLADGITASTPKAVAAAKAMAKRTMDAAKAQVETQSAQLQDLLTKAFQARVAAAKTPAEQALASMEEARAQQQRQQALADAQAQLAAAQSAEELLAAQKAYEAAQYDIQVAALQAQAAIERTELEGQQALQQKAFDARLAALNKYLASGHATAKGAQARIAKLASDFGLDLANIGALIGPSMASAITAGIPAAVAAAVKLTNAVKNAIRAGLKTGSPSRWAMEQGKFVSQGLAIGIARHTNMANFALAGLTGAGGTTMAVADAAPVHVRVFIGDQELRGMVRTEIVGDNTRLARRLLAGQR